MQVERQDYHHMAHNLCIRISFECINGKKCVLAPEQDIYLKHEFNDPSLNILLTDNYMHWKEDKV
jgi:hypothetical protein